LSIVVVASFETNAPCSYCVMSQNVIGLGGANDSYFYPRGLELEEYGILLATAVYNGPNHTVYFPIFESMDGGASWVHISNLTGDPVNGHLNAQPELYELPSRVGDYEKGTVLAAGVSMGGSSGSKILLFASKDRGYTWTFVSEVARGFMIFEPFLLYYDGQLVCYYSDARDRPQYSQKLSHQT